MAIQHVDLNPSVGSSIDATGFNGNLAPTDTTVQLIAQKVDGLVLGSSIGLSAAIQMKLF